MTAYVHTDLERLTESLLLVLRRYPPPTLVTRPVRPGVQGVQGQHRHAPAPDVGADQGGQQRPALPGVCTPRTRAPEVPGVRQKLTPRLSVLKMSSFY